MDIGGWLRSLGLERYEAAFRENEIDDTVLPSLTAEDLKDLGVGIVGHRRKLLDAIAVLGAYASAKEPTAEIASILPKPAQDTAERRHVTVMFCDLVGSTALSGRMDPEDLREVISAYQKCVAETVRRFGGFVAKYMVSGAGTGKGLLARCICIIAFGREPHAVTAGASAEELEKRIAAELIEGSPALFLDNLNNTAFKSDLLASAITERPAKVRLLGKSQLVPLNASAFVILTGNGLRVSEGNVRRFIPVDFDARTEDPESRPFKTDIRAEVTDRRRELLAALLRIWRWGRITVDIKSGLALGSVDGFDQDEAESKRDERAVILRRLLASKCDTLEAFELADRLFDACPCLVECFRKEGRHILGVGSIRDCRTYSALARGVAV